MQWYKRVREKKQGLVNHMNTIDEMIQKYGTNVNEFKGELNGAELPSK
jgi:hypothetical protein